MTEKEIQILVSYAIALGVFGEDSKEAKAIAEANANNAKLIGPMIEAEMLYREMLSQKNDR